MNLSKWKIIIFVEAWKIGDIEDVQSDEEDGDDEDSDSNKILRLIYDSDWEENRGYIMIVDIQSESSKMF